MAEPTHVDVAALRAIADGYSDCAETLSASVAALRHLRFDGALAGRRHAAGGDALREALGALVDDVEAWSRANAAVAEALRIGAQRYADTDRRIAATVG